MPIDQAGHLNPIWMMNVLRMPQAITYGSMGRSFWVARYANRKDLHEWELSWELAPKKGIRQLILVCPTRPMATFLWLGGSYAGDMSDRFFEYKVAGVQSAEIEIVLPNGRPAPSSVRQGSARKLYSHVIGCVDDIQGNCTIHAWEPPHELPYTEKYWEPANDGGGGAVWLQEPIVKRFPGRVVRGHRCRVESDGGKNLRLIGYHDNTMHVLSQDVLGMRAD